MLLVSNLLASLHHAVHPLDVRLTGSYAWNNSFSKRIRLARTVTTALQMTPGTTLLKRRYRRAQASPRRRATPMSKRVHTYAKRRALTTRATTAFVLVATTSKIIPRKTTSVVTGTIAPSRHVSRTVSRLKGLSSTSRTNCTCLSNDKSNGKATTETIRPTSAPQRTGLIEVGRKSCFITSELSLWRPTPKTTRTTIIWRTKNSPAAVSE